MSSTNKFFNKQKCLEKIRRLSDTYENIESTKNENKLLLKTWIASFEECMKESCERDQYELFGECLDG